MSRINNNQATSTLKSKVKEISEKHSTPQGAGTKDHTVVLAVTQDDINLGRETLAAINQAQIMKKPILLTAETIMTALNALVTPHDVLISDAGARANLFMATMRKEFAT